MAQYESESRTPKDDLIIRMAKIFGVRSEAITVPDIDTKLGLMHTLFALEDMYGLKIDEIDGDVCLTLDKHHKEYDSFSESLSSWMLVSKKLESGEISQEEYDDWKYNYPSKDTYKNYVKVPSEGLMNFLFESEDDK